MSLREGLFALALLFAGLRPAVALRRDAGLGAGPIGAFLALLALAALLFASGWPRLGGSAALALILLARRRQFAAWPAGTVERLGAYDPAAAALLGHLVVWMLAPADRAETLAWEAGSGVVAATYGLAALAKLREMGLGWADPRAHALLLIERSGPGVIGALRAGVAHRPALIGALARLALLVELCGLLFVWPEARPAVALALLGLHAGFALLYGYWHPEWALVLLVHALPA